MGFDPLNTDNSLAPESDTRHMPWTQQPSEAQLPQTQQELSPNVDMVRVHLCHALARFAHWSSMSTEQYIATSTWI